MKKSEFIEKLNRIEGDPEIVIWNAYVQDWNGVKELYPHELVRQSFEGYCNEVQLEKQVNDWRKAGMTEIEISERKKAIIIQLAKDEADTIRDAHAKDLERAFNHNENLIQLEDRTAQEVMNLNRTVIEEQIEMYRKVADDATLSAEKRAEAEEKLAGKIKQLNNHG